MRKFPKSSETLRRKKGPLGLLFIGLLAVLPFVIAGSSVAYGAHLENNDAFCASCHTEPESTFVGRAQSAASKTGEVQDLAAFHAGQAQAVKCIECHSGDGLSGRVDAMKLGARDLSAYVRGDFPQPSPLTHAIAD
ncbi:MAG: hypothetical protein GXP37_09045, partial [Chloroflexi bacterium]|nr:hypothetical protein [Chloroflexota bacterium]